MNWSLKPQITLIEEPKGKKSFLAGQKGYLRFQG